MKAKIPLFLLSKGLTLIHKTNNKDIKISHNPDRLIPHSISCNKYGSWVWVEGKNKFIIFIKNSSKILNIDIKDNFYNFGAEEDTPINRGKEIYKFAINNNIDIVKIKNVP